MNSRTGIIGSENAEKEPADFFERRKSEIVRLANSFRRSEIGSERNQDHERFPPTRRHGNERSQNDEQKNEIVCAVASSMTSDRSHECFFSRAKIDEIENEKYEENKSDRNQPLPPAMLQGPAKRYAFKKSRGSTVDPLAKARRQCC